MSSMNLREIFDAVTPYNIRSIPLIDTAMDIFIEQLEELSPIAIDITKIWDNISNKPIVGGSDTESTIVSDAKDKLRVLMLKTYVSILYSTLKAAETDAALAAVFERDGITDSPLNGDVFDVIGEEYFLSNKAFNEMVGTEKGLNYAYNLAQYLESREVLKDLEITDTEPFVMGIRGSVYRQSYEAIIKPLAHPLGFIYTYQQIINKYISDDYGIDDLYTFASIEVRQLDGYFYVFTSDANDDNIKSTFLTERTCLASSDIFTLDEYNEYVTVFCDKDVDDYEDNSDDDTYKILKFLDGTCIVFYTDDSSIRYCTYSAFKMSNYDPDVIFSFSDSSTLYLDYTCEYDIEYTEDMDFEVIGDLDDVLDISDTDDEFAGADEIDFSSYTDSGVYPYTNDTQYIYTSDGFYLYMYEND